LEKKAKALTEQELNKNNKGKKEPPKKEDPKKDVKKDNIKGDSKNPIPVVKEKESRRPYAPTGMFKQTTFKELKFSIGSEEKVIKQIVHEDIPDTLQTYIRDKNSFEKGSVYNFDE